MRKNVRVYGCIGLAFRALMLRGILAVIASYLTRGDGADQMQKRAVTTRVERDDRFVIIYAASTILKLLVPNPLGS